MTKETLEEFKKLSEHDQKEVLNLIRFKNEFKKKEVERKVKVYGELIEYLKEQKSKLHWEMSELSLSMCNIKFQEGKLTAYEEILNKIEKR